MAYALDLAARGLGTVWPNPAVGCLIYDDAGPDGALIAQGWTAPGGRPHAETIALEAAGGAARGATLYVSLEPCAHHGETPPCAEALIAARVGRVVIATTDADPRVAGKGIDRLRKAGIEVAVGLLEKEARQLNAGFFKRLESGRPLVTLKLASSLDGRIATAGGDSKWITGDAARAHGHMMRARHDAVLVGIGTVLADDPGLDCRLPGLGERSPLPVVADSGLRIAPDSRLVTAAAERGLMVLCRQPVPREKAAALRARGVEVIEVPAGEDDRPDLAEGLAALGAHGITRLLVEGGGQLAASLLRGRLVDRIAWFRGPVLIGGDGVAAIGGLGIGDMAGALRLVPGERRIFGDDILETFTIGP